MNSEHLLLNKLTSSSFAYGESAGDLLYKFAYSFGWQPSYEVENSKVSDAVNAHLMIEHGLENAALLTFMRDVDFLELNFSDRKRLLEISYNNLVDWHIFISKNSITYINNRQIPISPASNIAFSNHIDQLRYENFLKIAGKSQTENFQTLDDFLITKISDWKRILSRELNNNVDNISFSEFFNALIIARSVEDNKKKYSINFEDEYLIISEFKSKSKLENFRFSEFIREFIESVTERKLPENLINLTKIEIFDSIEIKIVENIIHDFCRNKVYNFDFSIISKHALSKIYEKYVSILRIKDYNQNTLFPIVPEEVSEKIYGEVYTPQYIASFFAKILKEEMGATKFIEAKAMDPACGSGIFLRTIAEHKIELKMSLTSRMPDEAALERIFESLSGIDIDQNAKKATQLSLSLLNLVFENKFSHKSNLVASEAIEHIQNSTNLINSYDIVIANPPFIPYDRIANNFRERISDFLEDYRTGKFDIYLAFIFMSIQLLKEGGYGALVLPKSFLIANNASKIRKLLSQSCTIKYLVDLSNVEVFEDTGAYVILLIFSKGRNVNEKCFVTKCQNMPGRALQSTIEKIESDGASHSIYTVSQNSFTSATWEISGKSGENTKSYLISRFPPLSTFMKVKEGIITGADDIFILDLIHINSKEKEIFRPLIPDKTMSRYVLPSQITNYVFYPFLNGKRLIEEEMKEKYPNTWKYLLSHKRKLVARASIKKDINKWWLPVRPRQAKDILIPKIISPHLIISPKFALDSTGAHLVTRSPYFIPVEDSLFQSFSDEMLKFFVAVLNSSVFNWYLDSVSHHYSKGYLLLEPKTIRDIPVPDPQSLDSSVLRNIVQLVERRMSAKENFFSIEDELDDLVSQCYQIKSSNVLTSRKFDA